MSISVRNGILGQWRNFFIASTLLSIPVFLSVLFNGISAGSTVVVGIIMFAIFYLLLVDGVVTIPPPRSKLNGQKVFCIGYSRTGTTSITVALKSLGLEPYHFCGHLVDLPEKSGREYLDECKVNLDFADGYDAHSDVAPAMVYKQLADLYPDAKFVLTQRLPEKWGNAMVRWCKKHRFLMENMPVPPTNAFFKTCYGDWANHDNKTWEKITMDHEREVKSFFRKRNESHRVLLLNITEGEGYDELCDFLSTPESIRPPPKTPFPHVDVFHLSFFKQPIWALRNLIRNIFDLSNLSVTLFHIFFLIALCVLFLPAFLDYGQCDRVCRRMYGEKNKIADTGFVAAAFSAEKNIIGVR